MGVGTAGTLWIGGRMVGEITAWRLVISPTTQKPTVFASGRFLRYYALHGKDAHAVVRLIPTTPPPRIGRPKPRHALRHQTEVAGILAEISVKAFTLAHGELIVHD